MTENRAERDLKALGARTPQASQLAADPVFWAAWLYHERGLKQDEVAGIMGCSRASVFNLLQRARDERIVTVAIDTGRLQQCELAFDLSSAGGLAECHLLPSVDVDADLYEPLGLFGARLLEPRISDREVLGVSWGRTVLALSQALSKLERPGVTVAQLNGSAMATYDFSPEFCTSNIASKLDARCVNLLAPGLVSSRSVKALLMKEPVIRQHFRLLRQCTKSLFGVTHLGGDTLLDGSGFMTEAQLEGYKRRGAVGFASGYFFDIEGTIIRQDFDERHIVMPLRDFLKIDERICIGGGPTKTEAIVGMLRAGLVSVLITDESTATAVLAVLASS